MQPVNSFMTKQKTEEEIVNQWAFGHADEYSRKVDAWPEDEKIYFIKQNVQNIACYYV